jgi:hypothetical protein
MIKLTRETVQVDGAKEGEEFHSVLWELGEVLIDHLKCTLENILHNGRYLVLHKSLTSGQQAFQTKQQDCKGRHHGIF